MARSKSSRPQDQIDDKTVFIIKREWRKGQRELGTTGYPRSNQPSNPPASGRTLVIPCRFSASATRALVASFGQEQ